MSTIKNNRNDDDNNNNNINDDDDETTNLPNDRLIALQQRSRAIAEREASRLARPDRPSSARILAPASKLKSAVSSTPFGMLQRRHGGDDGDDDDDDDEIEEWCGPFSIARQMIAARDEAKRKRERQQAAAAAESSSPPSHPLDSLVDEVTLATQREQNPSVFWHPNAKKLSQQHNNDDIYRRRRRRLHLQNRSGGASSGGGGVVPSLFHLCLSFIATHIDCVDALGPSIDSSIRRLLAMELINRGKFNGMVFDTLAEDGVDCLDIVDCSNVDVELFLEVWEKRLLPGGALRVLVLGCCGRCFGRGAVEVLERWSEAEKKKQSGGGGLEALSIGGAYALTDEYGGRLITVLRDTIQSVEFTACPLLGKQFCQAVGRVTHLKELSLGDVTAMQREDVMMIASEAAAAAAANGGLEHLSHLKLYNMAVVDDDVLKALLKNVTRLEGLHLRNMDNLTDLSLDTIRRLPLNNNSSNISAAPALKSLQLAHCRRITGVGLETFFTREIDGLPPPPRLKRLDLGELRGSVLTDEIIRLAVLAASAERLVVGSSSTSPTTTTTTIPTEVPAAVPQASSSARHGGIVHLTISKGCQLTDKSMEYLVQYCQHSLVELDVSFCPRISDKGLGYLVGKLGRQFRKLTIWGCAQITDEFLDGHDRVGDEEDGGGEGLEIVGAWMKKKRRVQ